MRLIDADALESLCDIMADKCDGIEASIWNQFRVTVEWQPTIDVVPVVRCKDCEYVIKDNYPDGNVPTYACVLEGAGVDATWFCPNGKRRRG